MKKYNMNNTNIWIQTPSAVMRKHVLYDKCAFHVNSDPLQNDAPYPCYLDTSDEGLYINLLSNSKFNLMFHGGDPCSSRFYDAISLDVINVVISDNFRRTCLIGSTKNDEGINSHIPWIKCFYKLKHKILGGILYSPFTKQSEDIMTVIMKVCYEPLQNTRNIYYGIERIVFPHYI
eukprot:1043419_1